MTGLYLPGDSAVHRLPAQVKIVASTLFVLVVVATPRQQWAAFAVAAVLVAVAAGLARLPPRVVLRRMGVELPFVLFALLLPFVAAGRTVPVGPLYLSEPGLWASWNVLIKSTLGVACAVILASTTAPADLVAGLARLRLPALIVAIAGFMVRYADVVAGEVSRMRVAMAARGFRARNVRSWPDLARSLGALFIRTFERGERVHRAMLSRGYDGSSTAAWAIAGGESSPGQWARALAWPGLAAVASLLTVVALP